MGSSFWWFYDAVVIAIAVGLIFIGAKKGFAECAAKFAALIIAAVIALPLSKFAAEYIYDGYIKAHIITAIQTALTDFSIEKEIKSAISQTGIGAQISESDISEIISKAENSDYNINEQLLNLINTKTGQSFSADSTFAQTLENNLAQRITNKLEDYIPGFAADKIVDFAVTNTSLFSDTIYAFSQPPDTAAQFIEENYIRNVMLQIVRTIAFLIFFAIINIALTFAVSSLKKLDALNAVGSLDSFLGGLLGAAEAFIVIMLIVFGVKLMILLTSNTLVFINDTTIDETIMFKHLYNLNLLGYYN